MNDPSLTETMFKVLTLIFSALLTVVSHACNQTPQVRTDPAPAVAPSPSGVRPPSREELLESARSYAKETRILNLADVEPSTGQTELRIWKGGGLLAPRCFSLRFDGRQPMASTLRVRVKRKKGDVGFIYTSIPLQPPKSGWESLLTNLRENGIGTTLTLKLDNPEPFADPDGERLLLEMKAGSSHTLVSYRDSTRSADGQRAFALCRNIEKEFNIQIGCAEI